MPEDAIPAGAPSSGPDIMSAMMDGVDSDLPGFSAEESAAEPEAPTPPAAAPPTPPSKQKAAPPAEPKEVEPTVTEEGDLDLTGKKEAKPDTEKAPADAAAETPADEEADTIKDIKPEFEKDGKVFFTKANGARLMEASQSWEKVLDVIPNATPETLVEQQKRAHGYERMMLDFRDPNGVAAVAAHLNQESPEAMARFAQILTTPEFAAANPKAYEAMSGAVAGRIADGIYGAALKNGDADARASLWYAAQMIDHMHGRKFKPNLVDGKPSATVEPDPLDAERQQLDQRKADLDAQEQQTHKAAYTEWQAGVQQELRGKRNDIIARALSKVPADQKLLIKGADTTFREAISDALKAAPEVQSTLETLFRRASLSRSQAERQKIQEEIVRIDATFAGRVVAAKRRTVLEGAGKTITQNSDAARSAAQKTAARRGPSSQGAAIPQSVSTEKLTPENMERVLEAAMMGAGT
jgi:hypothetical protein